MASFISVAELSDFLGTDATSNKGTLCVDAACDIVRTEAQQTLSEVLGETVVLDGTGTDALLLPERPVSAVSAVVESGGTLTVGTDYKLGDNGELYRLPGIIDNGWGTCELRNYWWPGRQNISVTYSHGYSDSDFPQDVRMVALTLAARLFVANTEGLTYERLGEYQKGFQAGGAADLSENDQRILYAYRRGK